MPIFKCNQCHHEWDGGHDATHCDWCGAPGDVVVAKTGLEQMLASMHRARYVREVLNPMYEVASKALRGDAAVSKTAELGSSPGGRATEEKRYHHDTESEA